VGRRSVGGTSRRQWGVVCGRRLAGAHHGGGVRSARRPPARAGYVKAPHRLQHPHNAGTSEPGVVPGRQVAVIGHQRVQPSSQGEGVTPGRSGRPDSDSHDLEGHDLAWTAMSWKATTWTATTWTAWTATAWRAKTWTRSVTTWLGQPRLGEPRLGHSQSRVGLRSHDLEGQDLDTVSHELAWTATTWTATPSIPT